MLVCELLVSLGRPERKSGWDGYQAIEKSPN